MRFLHQLFLTAVALAAAACAPMTVSSHVEREVDFAQYRTYDWGPADALPTGDPRLDEDPFFKDQVQGAVEKGLAARGLQRIALGDTPDVLIHYHANISERIDVDRLDRSQGYYGDGTPALIEYEAGTLVIDFIDAKTHRLIWRAWAQKTVEDELDNRDRMRKTIDEAVTRMLERLPAGF